MQVSSIQTCGNVKSITVKDSLWNKHTNHNYIVSNDKFDEFSAQIQDEAVSWKKKTRMTMILGTAAGAIVGAAAVVTAGSNSNAGGAAVNIADIDNDFTAKINNATITAKSVHAEADADTLIVNASGGVAAGTKSFGGMGSVTWQDIDNDLTAEFNNSKITTNTATAKAINNTQAVNVAGSVAFGKSAGIGATLAYNALDNTTGAYMKGNTISSFDNSNVNVIVDADNTGKVYGIGAGVAASTKVAINGSVAVNRGGSNTEAVIDNAVIDNSEEKNLLLKMQVMLM